MALILYLDNFRAPDPTAKISKHWKKTARPSPIML